MSIYYLSVARVWCAEDRLYKPSRQGDVLCLCPACCMPGCMEIVLYVLYVGPYSGHALSRAGCITYSTYNTCCMLYGIQPYSTYIIQHHKPPLCARPTEPPAPAPGACAAEMAAGAAPPA